MSYDKLTRENKLLFNVNCIKSVLPNVKKAVQEHASECLEAQACIELVEKWLEDPNSVSTEDLRNASDASDAASWASSDAAYAASASWASSDAAYAASNASSNASSAWAASASYTAANAAYADWSKAKKEEEDRQNKILGAMLEVQSLLETSDENEVVLYIRALEDPKKPLLLLQQLENKEEFEVATSYLRSLLKKQTKKIDNLGQVFILCL